MGGEKGAVWFSKASKFGKLLCRGENEGASLEQFSSTPPQRQKALVIKQKTHRNVDCVLQVPLIRCLDYTSDKRYLAQNFVETKFVKRHCCR